MKIQIHNEIRIRHNLNQITKGLLTESTTYRCILLLVNLDFAKSEIESLNLANFL